MNILDNELVRKYFDAPPKIAFPGKPVDPDADWLLRCVRADMVLTAMQQPIRKGERYLVTHDDGKTWKEQTLTHIEADEPYHPNFLRLPDRYQKKECECICHNTKENHNCCPDMNHSKTKPAPDSSFGVLNQIGKCPCGEYFGVTHPRAQNCTKTTPDSEKCSPYHSACYSCHSCIPCGKCKCKSSSAVKDLP